MNEVRVYAQQVADALVEVIETARWEARISSIRDLAVRAGMTHTALNKRMRHETPFNVRDLAAIAAALELEPGDLVNRAKALAQRDELAARRQAVLENAAPEPAKRAARRPGRPPGGAVE